jgi:hypothetical protein
MVFRLTKNDIVTIAIPSRIVLRLTAGRIVPPDRFNTGVYRAHTSGARPLLPHPEEPAAGGRLEG